MGPMNEVEIIEAREEISPIKEIYDSQDVKDTLSKELPKVVTTEYKLKSQRRK